MAFIGIDLGTTNSLVAIKRPQRKTTVFNIKGETGVSLEEENRFYLPSAVSSMNGDYLIGWEVLDNPEQEERIFSIKRLMGRGYDDKDKKRGKEFFIRDKIRETWGYKIRKPPKGTGEDIEVKLGDEWVTPQEISALILRRLKEIAEKNLETNIEGAVITVPAYFNDKQKWATREAARLAGLNVQMILDEPTAAAIAYGMETLGTEPRTVAVYDLGGGTFDISLLEIEGTNFSVAAKDGNNFLGGDDFDMEIVNYVYDYVRDNLDEKYVEILKEDHVKKNILKQRSKEAKEELSTELDTSIIITDILPGIEIRNIPLTRNKFEEMINSYIDETIEHIDSVLGKKAMTEDDVDKVLLVGGSARIPLVRRRLSQKFGEEKIAVEINPMQCVAIGAAIKSSWLLDKWECPNPEIKCEKMNDKKEIRCSACVYPRPETTSSTERPYGVRIYDREKQRYIFDVLIHEYTPYPLKESKKRPYGIKERKARILKVPFFAGEKSGEKSFHESIEKNTHLGTIWAVLPKGLSTDKTEIEFNLDNDGILDLESISITISSKPVEKKSIFRKGEEEIIGDEIEELLRNIPKQISNSDKREDIEDRACELFEKLFDYRSVSDKRSEKENLSEVRNKIEEIKKEIEKEIENGNGIGEKPIDVTLAAKNIILFYYNVVEKEYGWLPSMQDKSKKGEILKVLEELEKAIEEITKQKDVKQKEEWKIMLPTAKLSALLFSDRALNLLIEINVAANIAMKERGKADIHVPSTTLVKWIDESKSSENVFESRSTGERIEDAEKLKAAHTKIKMLLQQGKVKEAEEEYSEISHLVIYYLTEFARETVRRV